MGCQGGSVAGCPGASAAGCWARRPGVEQHRQLHGAAPAWLMPACCGAVGQQQGSALPLACMQRGRCCSLAEAVHTVPSRLPHTLPGHHLAATPAAALAAALGAALGQRRAADRWPPGCWPGLLQAGQRCAQRCAVQVTSWHCWAVAASGRSSAGHQPMERQQGAPQEWPTACHLGPWGCRHPPWHAAAASEGSPKPAGLQ